MINKQRLIKGMIIGIIAPIAAFIVYVAYATEKADPLYIYNQVVKMGKLPHIISLSLLINLLIFFINIKTNRDASARGILFSTILYGILIIILKFI